MKSYFVWGALLASSLLAGCGGHRAVEVDSGVRGPEGGVLRFDAAMLVHPPDAAIVPHDAGVRNDAFVPGSDAGHSCMGSAYPCDIVSASGCLSQLGCRTDGVCSGLSTSCYSLFDSFSCTDQDGCYWSSLSHNCSGSARSCSLESSSGLCIAQQGCSWRNTCAGVAESCYFLSQFDCTRQLGCYWN